MGPSAELQTLWPIRASGDGGRGAGTGVSPNARVLPTHPVHTDHPLHSPCAPTALMLSHACDLTLPASEHGPDTTPTPTRHKQPFPLQLPPAVEVLAVGKQAGGGCLKAAIDRI